MAKSVWIWSILLIQEKTSAGFSKKTSTFARRELARRVNLRNTPEIRFIVDQSIAYGVKMSKLIDEVNRKETIFHTVFSHLGTSTII